MEQSAGDMPASDAWLSEDELSCLNRLRIPKRKEEWRLGRWTAKRSVAGCFGLPCHPAALAKIEVVPGCSGAPIIFFDRQPASVTISLSHRAGRAVCAVAAAQMRIGCDVELIEEHSAAFLSDYFTEDEQGIIEKLPRHKRAFTATLLWSSKESALKALHMGLRMDTRHLNVSLMEQLSPTVSDLWLDAYPMRLSRADSGDEEAESDLWHPFRVMLRGSPAFIGWWRNRDPFVQTLALRVALEPQMFEE